MIIDEQGRLFRKINIIDFLVLLILLCFIPTLYFGYKLYNRKPIHVEENKIFTDIGINCVFKMVEPEVLKIIAVGDKEIDGKEAVRGEIVWVGKDKPYQQKFILGPDSIITKDHSRLKELFAKLFLMAEVKDSALFYKDKQILVNAPIEFKTDKYTLTAIPIATEDEISMKIVNVDLYVMFNELSADTLRLISTGDREVDKDGKVIAEILDIEKVENDKLEIDLGNNNFIIAEDSSRKQINVKMRLGGELRGNNKLYFKNKLLSHNSPIEFKMGKYIVKGTIGNVLLKEKWIHSQIKFTGIMPELAKLIAGGDIDKDLEGTIRGKIKAIISNNPSNVQILTVQDNKYINVANPFQRDVILALDLLCEEKDGVLFYKNYPMKVGNSIIFATDLYSASGVIISIGVENTR